MTRTPVPGGWYYESHEQVLAAMDEFREQTLATPGGARAFLIRAGLITPDGQPIQLIRD
jgi:hypothetical protein